MLEADFNLTNHTNSDLPIKIANYLPLLPTGIHSIGHLSQNQPGFLFPPSVAACGYSRGPFYAINKTDYKWCSASSPDSRHLPYKSVLL